MSICTHVLLLPWWLKQKRVCLQWGRPGFDPWIRKIPWRRKWQPTPVFLPGKSCGQRSQAGYSPWSRRVRHNPATNTLLLWVHDRNKKYIVLKWYVFVCGYTIFPHKIYFVHRAQWCLLNGAAFILLPMHIFILDDTKFKTIKKSSDWGITYLLEEGYWFPQRNTNSQVYFLCYPIWYFRQYFLDLYNLGQQT